MNNPKKDLNDIGNQLMGGGCAIIILMFALFILFNIIVSILK